jgi:peptidoglycan hydrolase CwlO-like protein
MANNARPRRPWEEGSDVPPATTTDTPGSVTYNTRGSIASVERNQSITHASHHVLSNHKLPSDPQSGEKMADWSQPSHQGSTQGHGESFARSKRRRTEDYVLSRTTDVADFAHRDKITNTSRDVEPSSVEHGICCRLGCTGPQCSSIRKMASGIGEHLATHEFLVHGSRSEDDRLAASDVLETPLTLLLVAIRSRLQESNKSLQSLLKANLSKKTGPLSKTSPGQDPSSSLVSNTNRISSMQNPSIVPSARLQLQSSEPRSGSPESVYVPAPPSVPAIVQSLHSSSASTCTSNTSALVQTLTPVSSLPSVQNEVLQDLSHQLSVKTLSHTALSREYDMLLQKLSRQRVKCAALERKFEVSDAEIVTLFTEKERLEDRVECLEHQAKELQQQRDEARKASEESKAQWMRIVENLGKLHGSKDLNPSGLLPVEKNWDDERAALMKRIEELEAAMSGDTTADDVTKSRLARLEDENRKFRERNTKLESGLAAAKAAALTLAAHGQNVGAVLNRALGE